MARQEWTRKRLSEDDVGILRGFVRQALLPFVVHVEDFYYSADRLDMSTGVHPWAAREMGGAMGYMVVRTGPRDFVSTSMFPFVNPSKLDIGVPGGTKASVLASVLEEPLEVEGYYVYYKRGKLCFLTRELAEAELDRITLQARVFLTREEAFAILNGETLPFTKNKIAKAFGVRRTT